KERGDREREPRAQGEHVAVSEVDELEDAVDEGVTEGDEGVEAAHGDSVDERLDEVGHVRRCSIKPGRSEKERSPGCLSARRRIRGCAPSSLRPGLWALTPWAARRWRRRRRRRCSPSG